MSLDDSVSSGARTQAYFDRLSETWSFRYSTKGSFQSRTQRFVHALGEHLTPPAKVLDFGCGSGDISRACLSAGYRVHGADRSPGMVEKARSAGIDASFDVISADNPLTLPYGEGQFDAVIASSVLEYVDDPRQCLAELRRVCRRDGWLLCTVPNTRHTLRVTEAWVKPVRRWLRPLVSLRAKDWLDYLALSVQRHPLSVWESLLQQAGWSCESVGGHQSTLWILHGRAL